MSLKHRQARCRRVECFTLVDTVPVDTVKDGTVLKYAPGGAKLAEEATDGSAAIAGVVYAPGCDGFFNAGDQVDVQIDGTALVTAGAAIVAGDTLIADGAGGVIAGTGFVIGVAICDAAAGEKVSIELNKISV